MKKIVYIFLIVVVFAGCSKDKSDNLVAIKIQLPWTYQTQFAGPIIAMSEGLYKKEGIAAEIVEGGFSINVASVVAKGDATFAVMQPDAVIYYNAQSPGEENDLVVIAVIFKESMTTFMVDSASDIFRVEDFVGKKVGVKEGTNVNNEFKAMLAMANVDYSSFESVPVQYDLGVFVRGDLDVFPGFVINEPYQIEKVGKKIRHIRPKDSGINLYGDVLVTSRKNLKSNPNIVSNFVEITLEGWALAATEPAKAIESVLALNPALDRDHQTFMLRESVKLMGDGTSEVSVWEETVHLLEEFGGLEKGIVNADKIFVSVSELSN